MSAKPAAPAPAPDGAAPAPKSKLLIIVIALVVVLIAAVAAVGYMLLKPKPDEGDEEEEVVEKVKEKEKKKKEPESRPCSFIPLDAFTVNLVPEQGEQFLQIIVSLRLEDAHDEPLIKGLMPQIRNNFLRLLSAKKGSELATIEGKDKLADELKDEVNSIIEPPKKGRPPEGPVEAVLFTSFIIQ